MKEHSRDTGGQSDSRDEVPLCVDLDGTLILSDVLWESIVRLWNKPICAMRVGLAAVRDKAAFSEALAAAARIDPAALPYRQDLLELLEEARRAGRRLVLVTDTHQSVARRVADYLGLFDEVLATHDRVNNAGLRKRDMLIETYGAGGFDYIGDHPKDLVVFAAARKSLLADPSPDLRAKVEKLGNLERVFSQPRRWSRILPRALRIHQWSKNVLLGVPLVTAHLILDGRAWALLALAFVCFNLVASATYVVNDLQDLAADRRHRHKRFRPLASGELPIPCGIGLAALLAVASLGMSFFLLPRLFLAFLVIYTILTLAYSLGLKRRLLVDALTLAMLYTLRIIAGAAAIGVAVSEWLLMFSVFFFISLALLKRFIELEAVEEGGAKPIPGRGYLAADLEIIHSVGPCSGLVSVLVLALYINSPSVTKLYATPQALWLLCPLLTYWITRIWLVAKRGRVHHDPIVFALMDKRSYVVAILAGIILLISTLEISKILGRA